MIDWNASADLNGISIDALQEYLDIYPKAGKRVIRICDGCGDVSEVSFHAISDNCKSCAQRIRRESPDDIKQVSESMKRRRTDNPELWDTKKYRAAQSKHRKRMSSSENPMCNPESVAKCALSKTGNKASTDTREKMSESITRYHFNKRWNNIVESFVSGELINDFTEPVRVGKNDEELYNWRNAVYKRDGYTCQMCYGKGNIEAHHIMKRSVYPHLSYDVDNGITLCYDCHRETLGKEDFYVDFLSRRLV